MGPTRRETAGAFYVRAALFLLLALPLFACGGVTQNVRAFRAYANEDPNIKVAIDRVEDMSVTLELVDRILLQTTYTPGDMWPRRLPMTDAQFREIKAELKEKYPYNGGDNLEVPILKCYRFHIEKTMAEYGPPPDKPDKPLYPSLLDAVGSLNPRDPKAIKNHWVAFRDANEKLAQAAEEESAASKAGDQNAIAAARDKVAKAQGAVLAAKADVEKDALLLSNDAELTKGDKQQIARDGFTVLSVAFRIELEALAMIPIVVIQAVRSLPNAPKDLTYKPHGKIIRQVSHLPDYVAGIKESFTRQAAMLEQMTSQLAKALKTSVEKSPGFELTESVVDQIVGITLDSFRVDLRAGGEAFIYSSVGTSDKQGSDDVKYDYTGRQYKLDYRIQPIVLAQARLDVVLDWIRMPGVANLGFGYATDRVYRSGGSIESNSLTNQLGVDGVASDVLDAGLGLLGVRSSVKIATFTAGEVRQVRADDISQTVAKSPLKLKYTEVDVGYDILWLMNEDSLRASMEELVISGRYMRYQLPRIAYELENRSTDPNVKNFTFLRESPPQPVTSEYWMLHVQGRFGVGEAPRWSPYLDVGLGAGAGPTKFYFVRDPLAGDFPGNREEVRELAWVLNGSLAGGLRWRMLPRGSRLRLDLRLQYRADFFYQIINRTSTGPSGGELKTDFGSFDIFHGPNIAIRGAL
jgi:hypothetical protein